MSLIDIRCCSIEAVHLIFDVVTVLENIGLEQIEKLQNNQKWYQILFKEPQY